MSERVSPPPHRRRGTGFLYTLTALAMVLLVTAPGCAPGDIDLSATDGEFTLAFSDPYNDVAASSGAPATGMGELDIVSVEASLNVSDSIIRSMTVVVRLAGSGNSTVGVKFGGESVFLTGNGSTRVYTYSGELGYDRFNTTIGVMSLREVNGTIYYDYAFYTPPAEPEVVVREVPVRHYPSLWNVFGITALMAYAFTSLLAGGAIITLGTRKEKVQASVLFITGLVVLAVFAYLQFFSSAESILGVFNWSEVPMLMTAVALVSALAGALFSLTVALSIIVMNQRRP